MRQLIHLRFQIYNPKNPLDKSDHNFHRKQLTGDLLGRLDELHIVLVDMLLQGGGNRIAVTLDLGLRLLQFRSADAILHQLFDVCESEFNNNSTYLPSL